MSSVSTALGWNKIDFNDMTPGYFGKIYVRYCETDSRLYLCFLKQGLLLPFSRRVHDTNVNAPTLCHMILCIPYPIHDAGDYSSDAEIIQSRLVTIFKIAEMAFSFM